MESFGTSSARKLELGLVVRSYLSIYLLFGICAVGLYISFQQSVWQSLGWQGWEFLFQLKHLQPSWRKLFG
jgi:hypothetical protein